MRSSGRTPYLPAAILAACVAAAAPEARAQAAEENPWEAGRNWMSVRAGYAKSAAPHSGNGGLGYGIGFSHMGRPLRLWRFTLLRHYSVGGFVHHEMISHFGNAVEVEIPASLEVVRHFQWKAPFKPYLGLGVGTFYRKAYRTGDDRRTINPGGYVTFGGNTPVGGRHLLGFDGRLIRVDSSYIPPHPVFGPGSARERGRDADGDPLYEKRGATHWSAKLNYTLVY